MIPLPVSAPVDVGFDAVRLPADMLEVLDAKAPEPNDYLSATARRWQVGRGRPCSSDLLGHFARRGGAAVDRLAQDG